MTLTRGKRRIGLAAAVTMTLAIGPGLVTPPSGVAHASPAPAAPKRGTVQSHPQVSWNAHHGESKPLRDLPSAPYQHSTIREPQAPQRSAPRTPTMNTPAQTTAGTAHATTVLTTFAGITSSSGATPPDPNIAVSPTQVVEVVNLQAEIWDKSGTVLMAPKSTNTLWTGFPNTDGNGCATHNDGDPVVRYDALAGRWVITQFSLPNELTTGGPSFECVAVSKTGDATGEYWLYDFTYPFAINDYPKLGVWSDGYYITFNMFDGATSAYAGAESCVYERAAMLDGFAARQQCFLDTKAASVLPASVEGSTPPPAGAPEQEVSINVNAPTFLDVRAFHADWVTTANSTFVASTVGIDPYAATCATAVPYSGACVPEPGSGKLDDLDDRLMFPLNYRNIGGHQSLVVNHTVDAGSGQEAPRWYELRVRSDGLLDVNQSGTYAPADGLHRWMGSASMDKAGDIALGFSTSSSTTDPSIHYTGRSAADPPGQMTEAEGTLATGTATETTTTRWGDYTSMIVDPGDDCTFWYVNEIYNVTGSATWTTRISSLKFNACGADDFSLTAPASDTRNHTASVPVTTAVTKGVAQDVALSLSGPTGITGTFSPATVTAGNGSTLTIDASGVAPGTYTLQVGGASASVQHAVPLTLTVTDDFSVSVAPTAGTAPADVTVSTQKLGPATPTLDLTTSGIPAGAVATFTATSVAVGGGSTLHITPGTAAGGTYPVTVTATDNSVSPAETRSATYTLTIANDFGVSANPKTLITNGSATRSTTLSTTRTSGTADSLTLTASGLPAGASVTFTPPSVTAGSPSTAVLTPGTAASGTYPVTLKATDPTTGTSHSVVVSYVVDRTRPTASLTRPASLVTVATSAAVTWTGSDTISGVSYYDVRYVRAAYNAGFSAWPSGPSVGWSHLTVTGKTATGLVPGYTYCYEVRAVDRAGNTSAWSASRCTAVPLDDRALTTSSGWTRGTGSGFWLGTVTRTAALNATLARTGAQVDRIALVFTRCTTCGVVGVYVNGVLVGKVSTYGTAANKVVVVLPRFTYRSGTVVLKVLTSRKPVYVDGLVLTRV